MRKILASFLEIVEIATIALGAVFLVRTFLIQPFLVNGGSMLPNFSHGDYLLVDELTYRFRPPTRGEVVVFRYPNNESVYFIKRIIGLPGEIIQIRDSKVTVFQPGKSEGVLLSEKYLPSAWNTGGNAEYKIANGQYLVLGDNRSYSFDSRSWGPLDQKEIVGIVRLRLWPFQAAKVFAATKY